MFSLLFFLFLQDLTFLTHIDQLVLTKEVNLSNNHLSTLEECHMLQCVRILDVSNNKLRHITKRHALRVTTLQELSLSNNSILCFSMKIICVHICTGRV